MPRKIRLSHKKNWERKRQAKKRANAHQPQSNSVDPSAPPQSNSLDSSAPLQSNSLDSSTPTLLQSHSLDSSTPTLPQSNSLDSSTPTLPQSNSLDFSAPTLPQSNSLDSSAPTLPQSNYLDSSAPTPLQSNSLDSSSPSQFNSLVSSAPLQPNSSTTPLQSTSLDSSTFSQSNSIDYSAPPQPTSLDSSAPLQSTLGSSISSVTSVFDSPSPLIPTSSLHQQTNLFSSTACFSDFSFTSQDQSSDSSLPYQAGSSESSPPQHVHLFNSSTPMQSCSNSSLRGQAQSSTTCSSDSSLTSQAPLSALQDLHNSLKLPSKYWTDQSLSSLSSIKLCKLLSFASMSTSKQPVVITHCVIVNTNLQWSLFVHNQLVAPSTCRALESLPSCLTEDSLSRLLHVVDQLHICAGHPEKHFIEFALSRKGVLRSQDGSVTALIDDYAPVVLNGVTYMQTIRTASCERLVHGLKCASCQQYRSTLRSAYSRFRKRQPDKISDTSSHVNVRYMTTPEKRSKMKKMRLRAQDAEQELKKLQKKVEQLTSKHGETIDTDLHNELLGIMDEKSQDIYSMYPEGTFSRLFWKEQFRAAKAGDPHQVRWHPLIIRWCLNLKLISSSAYHATRTAGFIKLPSERTLRDYTHYFKHHAGFQPELNRQLQNESKVSSLPECQKYCGFIFDEMKVKENLVYDKCTGSVVGFINITLET